MCYRPNITIYPSHYLQTFVEQVKTIIDPQIYAECVEGQGRDCAGVRKRPHSDIAINQCVTINEPSVSSPQLSPACKRRQTKTPDGPGTSMPPPIRFMSPEELNKLINKSAKVLDTNTAPISAQEISGCKPTKLATSTPYPHLTESVLLDSSDDIEEVAGPETGKKCFASERTLSPACKQSQTITPDGPVTSTPAPIRFLSTENLTMLINKSTKVLDTNTAQISAEEFSTGCKPTKLATSTPYPHLTESVLLDSSDDIEGVAEPESPSSEPTEKWALREPVVSSHISLSSNSQSGVPSWNYPRPQSNKFIKQIRSNPHLSATLTLSRLAEATSKAKAQSTCNNIASPQPSTSREQVPSSIDLDRSPLCPPRSCSKDISLQFSSSTEISPQEVRSSRVLGNYRSTTSVECVDQAPDLTGHSIATSAVSNKQPGSSESCHRPCSQQLCPQRSYSREIPLAFSSSTKISPQDVRSSRVLNNYRSTTSVECVDQAPDLTGHSTATSALSNKQAGSSESCHRPCFQQLCPQRSYSREIPLAFSSSTEISPQEVRSSRVLNNCRSITSVECVDQAPDLTGHSTATSALSNKQAGSSESCHRPCLQPSTSRELIPSTVNLKSSPVCPPRSGSIDSSFRLSTNAQINPQGIRRSRVPNIHQSSTSMECMDQPTEHQSTAPPAHNVKQDRFGKTCLKTRIPGIAQSEQCSTSVQNNRISRNPTAVQSVDGQPGGTHLCSATLPLKINSEMRAHTHAKAISEPIQKEAGGCGENRADTQKRNSGKDQINSDTEASYNSLSEPGAGKSANGSSLHNGYGKLKVKTASAAVPLTRVSSKIPARPLIFTEAQDWASIDEIGSLPYVPLGQPLLQEVHCPYIRPSLSAPYLIHSMKTDTQPYKEPDSSTLYSMQVCIPL